MPLASILRTHWAALRTLAVLTVITGVVYPLLIWVIAQAPGLRDKADGSLVVVEGKAVGSSLIGQLFADGSGTPMPGYLQGRPSNAGTGYDAMSSGASNLGPESILDTPGKPSLLTQVCTRSAEVARANGRDGARPFCTAGGVGAVLSVIGPRDHSGMVTQPTRVLSVNEPCAQVPTPFLASYRGVAVHCLGSGDDPSLGQLVAIRGAAPVPSAIPADAVTAGGSGLDPDISPEYADLQAERIAAARHIHPADVRAVIAAHTAGRTLGFLGEPHVNVLTVNLALDAQFPGG